MNKVISFCLWGNSPMYCIGAIKNTILAKEIYPGWEVWIYYDSNTVSSETITSLEENDAICIQMSMKPNTIQGMFWRFLPATKPYVDIMISRDCDSRLNVREKACVDEWLESGKMFHIMRDHVHHNIPILGGMWGINGSNGEVITKKDIDNWPRKKDKGYDQVFLQDIIWPRVKGNHISHDQYYKDVAFEKWGDDNAKDFPEHPPMKEGTFVGEIFVK